jgi:hypothetical protein
MVNVPGAQVGDHNRQGNGFNARPDGLTQRNPDEH